MTAERHDRWDSFDLGEYEADLLDLNSAVTRVAERALDLGWLRGARDPARGRGALGGHLAMRCRGPAGYQDRVRRTLVQFVDPEKRISLPPVEPGGGWQAAAFLPGSRLNLR